MTRRFEWYSILLVKTGTYDKYDITLIQSVVRIPYHTFAYNKQSACTPYIVWSRDVVTWGDGITITTIEPCLFRTFVRGVNCKTVLLKLSRLVDHESWLIGSICSYHDILYLKPHIMQYRFTKTQQCVSGVECRLANASDPAVAYTYHFLTGIISHVITRKFWRNAKRLC